MISTKDYSLLPDRKSLETICKAISVLDAILSQEWQYRYYSFNANWNTNGRCLQMRNGSGEEMLILFREDGCAINGFAHEYERKEKARLTQNVPTIFNEFFFGEPVASIGMTFCLWTTELKEDGISLDTVKKIYDGRTLTREMVLSIVDELEDWGQLEKDVIEIGYPFDFKGGSESQKKSKWKFW